ncbi:podocalyxin [Glossophaga mutica]
MCRPPSPAQPGPAAASALQGEGAGAGADRTGVSAAARPAAAAQTPPATQLPAAPPPPGSEPQPALQQRPREGATSKRLGSTGSPPGRRSHRQASASCAPPHSHRSGSRSLSQPRSHLLWARGQDTMSSALALSALLLLLLRLPLPSLSDNGESTSSMTIPMARSSTAPAPSSSGSLVSVAPALPSTNTSTAPSDSGVTSTIMGDQKSVQGSGQTTQPTPMTVPVASTKPGATASQDRNKDTAPTGTQSSLRAVTAEITTTKGGSQTPPPTLPASSTTGAPPTVPSLPAPTGSQQVPSGSTAPNAPGSSATGPPPSRSPNVTTGHAASQGTTNTPKTLATSAGNQQTCNKMPAVPGTTPAVPGTTPSVPGASPSIAGASPSVAGTLPPTVSPTGPVTPPPVRPTSSSTQLAPTAPQDSNIPLPTSALKDERIKCEPPKRLNETMLILNITKTNLCAGSPSDGKLATLLCKAAKADFDPSRDQCRIRLVPASDVQAVAIKEITIQTKLLPKDMYELLKDKWDDLKEVGVSDMQLGDQGPPEETEDRFSTPLIITIVCMASFLLLVAALYGCCHQRLSHRKDQQRLTEELQTVENGYHDNPTLEVMETSSEMQEKKVVNLNGELGDSWIVPLDNLMKDDLDEEEDTHL